MPEKTIQHVMSNSGPLLLNVWLQEELVTKSLHNEEEVSLGDSTGISQ